MVRSNGSQSCWRSGGLIGNPVSFSKHEVHEDVELLEVLLVLMVAAW